MWIGDRSHFDHPPETCPTVGRTTVPCATWWVEATEPTRLTHLLQTPRRSHGTPEVPHIALICRAHIEDPGKSTTTRGPTELPTSCGGRGGATWRCGGTGDLIPSVNAWYILVPSGTSRSWSLVVYIIKFSIQFIQFTTWLDATLGM